MTNTVLVLGATGGVGGETARALLAHGWRVRGLARRVPATGDGIEWVQGDALDADAVMQAARDADAIVHAVNPPGYRDWEKLVLPMLDNSIAAARATGARLALPGTIYNYDPHATPVALPDSPQHAFTRKGAIRIAMERRIAESGVRAIILRAGDFFGPRPGNNWFSQGLVKPGKPVRSILHPGKRGVGHAWAYLPDVGEAFARLLNIEASLPDLARYHFAGTWDGDGTAITRAIARAAGKPDIKPSRMPWALLPLIAPFNPTMREMIEMRSFWEHPVRLDNAALIAAIGPEPHTPLDRAVAATLTALGCIDR
ncbi:NAD(P)H-binding protein [Sphingomonas sp. So64.6b]|uniref:NAD-dependent epimerase/dehydratase family protein n=1 Tax=Sphingomonas sp. So64.6b TaxID=2997354 RepID=UPI001601BC13|nr:NAD-dependent epimerase/dehydratase family protein [Sphingomonas sp. So64.6b]QNA85688.1 NAD(P)H-binding protein [Sphingomonas sp. So64.6b]